MGFKVHTEKKIKSDSTDMNIVIVITKKEICKPKL